MAGPRMIGIRDVIDPYEGLQKAVSNAGDIYREYEKSSREADVHNAKMQEVERVNRQRDMLKNYDPRIGADGRGLTVEAQETFKQEEDAAIEYLSKAQQRGEVVPTPEALKKELTAARAKFATREPVRQAIYQDMVGMGFTPAEAMANAEAASSGYRSQADMIAQEASRVKTLQENLKDVKDNAYKELQLQVDVQNNDNQTMLTNERIKQGNYISSRYNAKNGTYSKGGKSGSTVTNPAAFTSSREVLETNTDGGPSFWPWRDSSGAAVDIQNAVIDYNQARIKAGRRPLTEDEVVTFTLRGINQDFDNTFAYDSLGAVRVGLENTFGKADDLTMDDSNTGGAGWRAAQSSGADVSRTVLPQAALDTFRQQIVVKTRSLSEIESKNIRDYFSKYRAPEKAENSAAGIVPRPAGSVQASAGGGQGTSSGGAGGSSNVPELTREEQIAGAKARRDEIVAENRAKREEANKAKEVEETKELANTVSEDERDPVAALARWGHEQGTITRNAIDNAKTPAEKRAAEYARDEFLRTFQDNTAALGESTKRGSRMAKLLDTYYNAEQDEVREVGKTVARLDEELAQGRKQLLQDTQLLRSSSLTPEARAALKKRIESTSAMIKDNEANLVRSWSPRRGAELYTREEVVPKPAATAASRAAVAEQLRAISERYKSGGYNSNVIAPSPRYKNPIEPSRI